jgi:hypothetical protein
MNIKIAYHFMPWEIDYALLTFTQLKKSSYYLPEDVDVEIDSVLNLSSHIINWKESKLPKEYFISKYNNISKLLIDYKHNPRVFEEDRLYGHLDLQRECKAEHIDYYMGVCPDMYFSEHLLTYMIEGAKQIPNKYFILTPQIHKLWDPTWDEITNPEYRNVPYNQWDQVDTFDIRNNLKINSPEISLIPTERSKWAGWFDLYNKAFYEELCPIHDDWSGYGPWDWYSLMLTEHLKHNGADFQQYVLSGQTIFEYSVGPLKETNGFSKHYRDLISTHDIPNQRKIFESKMRDYLQKGIKLFENK